MKIRMLFSAALAVGLSVAASAQSRATFATRVAPQMFTTGNVVTIGAGIDDLRNITLASRNCYFLVGIGLVRTPNGPIVVPPTLIGSAPFQSAGRTGVAAKMQVRVPRLPTGISITFYFQNVALIQGRGGTTRWWSMPAKGLLRT